jgi:hypothetical protein
LVYGKLDEATRHAAIAKLPGHCDAGVPNRAPRAGTEDAPGTAPGRAVDGISVEKLVPRVGIEPTTRGFSVSETAAAFDVPYSENDEIFPPRLRLVK